MDFLKPFKGQLIFTFLLSVLLLIMPFEDYMEQTFLFDSMNYPESAINIVKPSDGMLIVPEQAGHITLSTNEFYLKSGSYKVTFNVNSEKGGGFVEVVDPLYVNPDNTSGKTLAQESIPQGNTSLHLPFQVEDYAECVQLRVHAENGLEFHSIYLLSQMGLYQDPYIYVGLLLLGSCLLLAYRSRRRVRSEVLAILAFAALWSTLPFFYNWLSYGHDIFFHYGRLFTLSEGLKMGQFPVRIHARMYRGFTYMCPVFYSEFFLYPFALLEILGMSPIGCYRLLMAAINFATAGVSYYSFSRLCRSRSLGLTAAFLYTLSLFRLTNLITRAAVGEALAGIFLPLLMLGMYQLFLGDSRKWLTSVLAFTALLQSHLITTELAIGFSALFALCFIRRLKDRKRLARLLLAAAVTLLLNLWYIVPFLDHMRFAVHGMSDVRNLAGYAVHLAQFFDMRMTSPAGEVIGRTFVSGKIPYTLGLLPFFGTLLFLLLLLQKKKKLLHPFYQKLGSWCLGFGVLSLYASSVYFPWERLQNFALFNRIFGNIQFASRFLPIANVFLCLTASIGIFYIFREVSLRRLFLAVCALFVIYNSGQYFSDFANTSQTFVTWMNQMDHSQDTDSNYLISDNHKYFSVRRMYLQDVTFTASEGVSLKNCKREGTDASFTYEKEASIADAYVDVPFNYYPYFHAYDSQGNRLPLSHGELIRLRVALPALSSDTVTIRFELPSFYRVFDLISLLTFILLAAMLLANKKYFRKKVFTHGH